MAYYIAAYSSTKEVLVIPQNPPHGAYCKSALVQVHSAYPAHGTTHCRAFPWRTILRRWAGSKVVIIWRFSCTQHNGSKNALPA